MSDESTTSVETAEPASRGIPIWLWMISVFASIAIGGAVLRYMPTSPQLPDRLRGLTGMSPAKDLSELNILVVKNRFQSSVVGVGLLGLCFGLVGIPISRKPFTGALATLLAGGVTGFGVGAICGSLHPIFSAISVATPPEQDAHPLWMDVVPYSIVGLLLGLPFAIAYYWYGNQSQRKAFGLIALSGVVVGCAYPLLLTLFSSDISVEAFPPQDMNHLVLWLFLFGAGIVLSSILGSKGNRKV